MKTLAGIVLYNPNLSRLKENIDAVINQVNCLICVDNGSSNFHEIKELLYSNDNYYVIKNDRNLGIATALKQIMDFAIKNKFEWVLTLDQDSVCMPGLVDKYLKYTDLSDVGILTCKIIDRNFAIEEKLSSEQEYFEIEKCITAASFIKTEAYAMSDGFDERMFIDGVDFDICFNLKKMGFKIYKVNYVGLLQEVGNGKNVSLLGKRYIIYNHPPIRCYYISRNNIYLAKKYKKIDIWHMFLKELAAEFAIILYEENKLKKIAYRWHGIFDGIRMKI